MHVEIVIDNCLDLYVVETGKLVESELHYDLSS